MRVWNVIVVAVLLGTGLPVLLHYQQHGVIHPVQVALAFFFWLNTIIALWEICLFFEIDRIEEQHRRFVAAYRGRELALVREFFFSRIPARRLLSPSAWAGVWSAYSVYDESYADRRSFGFFVDIGNGFSTLIPSLLFLYGMTFHGLPARALGIVGLIACWQMWYGTVLYLVSFFLNGRHRGHPKLHIAVIVGMSNGLWLGLPLLGIYASIVMIYRDSYGLFVGW